MIYCIICGTIQHDVVKKTCREEMTAHNVDTKHLIGDDAHIWREQPGHVKFYGKGIVAMLTPPSYPSEKL